MDIALDDIDATRGATGRTRGGWTTCTGTVRRAAHHPHLHHRDTGRFRGKPHQPADRISPQWTVPRLMTFRIGDLCG